MKREERGDAKVKVCDGKETEERKMCVCVEVN